MDNTVSIVIPTFNREKLIEETFLSIKNQTYKNWECIIVDDHSTDSTIQVINNFIKNDSRFKLYIRPDSKQKGANSCRNFGLEMASGHYLMFFDSDDLLKVNCLENRVSEFEKNKNYDMIIFSMGIFDFQTKPQLYEKRKVINYNISDTIKEFVFSNVLPWNVCRPIFKLSFIKNRISFNENIHNFQDDDFNLRILYNLKPNYLSIDYTDCYYRYDIQSINKYNNFIGYQNLLNSLFEYYKTVFLVLDNNSKINNRNELINKLFYQIKFNVRPNISVYLLNETIKLFRKEIKLSSKEIIALKTLKIVNLYLFNIKGYYFITKKIKDCLLKTNVL
jgi:glycosyltransferase involved in cell wall biosynthesis